MWYKRYVSYNIVFIKLVVDFYIMTRGHEILQDQIEEGIINLLKMYQKAKFA